MPETPLVDRYTPAVLMNEGIAVHVAVPGETQIVEGEEVPARAIRYVRFTARHTARAEDLYDGCRGSIETFEDVPLVDAAGEPLLHPETKAPVMVRKKTGREERVFYGQEALQFTMSSYPTKVTFDLLSMMWKLDPEALDEILIPGEMPVYSIAISNAWAMAQGVDPSSAATAMKKALDGLADRREALGKQLTETMDQALDANTDSAGPSGPPDGSPPAEA